MRFIDKRLCAASGVAAGAAAVMLAGCTSRAPSPAPAPAPAQRPPASMAAPAPAPSAIQRARSWDEYRELAARRMVQTNPQGTYMGVPPEPLLAIPVLEVELHADGSVARINVQRRPRQALDTVDLAVNAVRRAAPYGPVGHLPKPWKFTEVFLFDDDRRFKPRSLD